MNERPTQKVPIRPNSATMSPGSTRVRTSPVETILVMFSRAPMIVVDGGMASTVEPSGGSSAPGHPGRCSADGFGGTSNKLPGQKDGAR